MKRLNVDLRSRSAPPVWLWPILVAGTLGTLALWAGALDATDRLGELTARRDGLMREIATQAATESTGSPVALVVDRAAGEARAALLAGWPAMLTALETVDIDGVDLRAVEIAATERWIVVDAEFLDFATLLRFVDELNAGEPLPRWAIVQATIQPGKGAESRGTAVGGTVRAAW